MTTITISPEVQNKKELVAIPLKDYERFLAWKKDELVDEIILEGRQAVADFRAGKLPGPFKSAAELVKHLHKKTRR